MRPLQVFTPALPRWGGSGAAWRAVGVGARCDDGRVSVLAFCGSVLLFAGSMMRVRWTARSSPLGRNHYRKWLQEWVGGAQRWVQLSSGVGHCRSRPASGQRNARSGRQVSHRGGQPRRIVASTQRRGRHGGGGAGDRTGWQRGRPLHVVRGHSDVGGLVERRLPIRASPHTFRIFRLVSTHFMHVYAPT